MSRIDPEKKWAEVKMRRVKDPFWKKLLEEGIDRNSELFSGDPQKAPNKSSVT